jgi:3-oxoacyl-[acyl-carrier-protein] synthase II
MGLVSPVGLSPDEGWGNILAGKSGIAPLTHFDVSGYPTRFGGSVWGFDATKYMGAKEVRKTDPFIHYGVAAARQALDDSGLEITPENTARIGISVGSGIGGIGTIEKNTLALHESGKVKKVSPFFVPSSIINMVAGYISIEFGIKGPNLATVTACTTGTHCLGVAARLIAHGDADAFLAGGSEMGTSPVGLAGFCAARALSTRNDDPEGASRPWDRDRDGFVLSDGAAVLMLESYEHAKARGANIYAELIGFGMSGDAHHITLPAGGGDGAYRCMDSALRDANLGVEAVDYINAHGTSTSAGDIAETEAVKKLFGSYARRMPVSSTKSMTGHLLGAAGAVEALFAILSICDQVAPPTINLDNPDEACDLDYVPHTAREMPIDVVLSNSFGFGGTNGTVVFRKLT